MECVLSAKRSVSGRPSLGDNEDFFFSDETGIPPRAHLAQQLFGTVERPVVVHQHTDTVPRSMFTNRLTPSHFLSLLFHSRPSLHRGARRTGGGDYPGASARMDQQRRRRRRRRRRREWGRFARFDGLWNGISGRTVYGRPNRY
jgi:hypothetical protein